MTKDRDISFFGKKISIGTGDSLKIFLLSKIQPWRQEIMLKNGGIRVLRQAKEIKDLNLSFDLLPGDIVIIDEAFGNTWIELRSIASQDFRDYFWVPNAGKSDYESNIDKVLEYRPKTFRVSPELKDLAAVVRNLTLIGEFPIRHLIIGGHANSYGQVFVPSDPSFSSNIRDEPKSDDKITFEILEKAIEEKHFQIHLPPDRNPSPVLLPRPESKQGKRMPAALIIKGCRIGLQKPFLNILKKALGPMIDVVVAPKYYDAAEIMESRNIVIEYMQHSFALYKNTQFTSRDQLIEAFKELHLKDWLGKSISESDLMKYLTLPENKPFTLHPTAHVSTLKIAVKIPGQKKSTDISCHYEYKIETIYRFRIVQTDKPNEEEMKKRFYISVKDTPKYQKNHNFPMWERLGLKSLDDIVENVFFEPKKENNDWIVRLARYVYEIRTPLLDEKGSLLCNVYPEKGSPHIGIDENDKRLFGQAGFIPSHFVQNI